jgi:hypothetical protein
MRAVVADDPGPGPRCRTALSTNAAGGVGAVRRCRTTAPRRRAAWAASGGELHRRVGVASEQALDGITEGRAARSNGPGGARAFGLPRGWPRSGPRPPPQVPAGRRPPPPASARFAHDSPYCPRPCCAGRGWSDAADGPQDGAHIAARTCTRCSNVPTFPARMCWPVIRSAASTSKASPRNSQMRSPAWCSWTPPAPQLGPPLPTKTESYNVFDRVSALFAGGGSPWRGRLLNPIFYGSLPPRSRDEARANSSTARHLASWPEEFREGSRSMQQASSLTNLDSKPLIVLTADTGHDAKWQSPQDQMAKLSTNSLHVSPRPPPINRSPRTRPTPPQPASDVVASIRTSQPLAK